MSKAVFSLLNLTLIIVSIYHDLIIGLCDAFITFTCSICLSIKSAKQSQIAKTSRTEYQKSKTQYNSLRNTKNVYIL